MKAIARSLLIVALCAGAEALALPFDAEKRAPAPWSAEEEYASLLAYLDAVRPVPAATSWEPTPPEPEPEPAIESKPPVGFIGNEILHSRRAAPLASDPEPKKRAPAPWSAEEEYAALLAYLQAVHPVPAATSWASVRAKRNAPVTSESEPVAATAPEVPELPPLLQAWLAAIFADVVGAIPMVSARPTGVAIPTSVVVSTSTIGLTSTISLTGTSGSPSVATSLSAHVFPTFAAPVHPTVAASPSVASSPMSVASPLAPTVVGGYEILAPGSSTQNTQQATLYTATASTATVAAPEPSNAMN